VSRRSCCLALRAAVPQQTQTVYSTVPGEAGTAHPPNNFSSTPSWPFDRTASVTINGCFGAGWPAGKGRQSPFAHALLSPKRSLTTIILARSKGRIAWLQRKVLVAMGAVAATIPIVAFQQAPVSRQSRVPRVGHVREQPQHQWRVNENVVYCCCSWIFGCGVRE